MTLAVIDEAKAAPVRRDRRAQSRDELTPPTPGYSRLLVHASQLEPLLCLLDLEALPSSCVIDWKAIDTLHDVLDRHKRTLNAAEKRHAAWWQVR